MTNKGYLDETPLVDVAWLAANRDNPRLRLIDARSAQDYAKGHLPGAANVDVAAIRTENTDPRGVEDFNQRQIAALRAAGVNNGDRIVAYDEQSLTNAARAVWVCHYYGLRDAHLLDGGLAAWQAAGYALTDEVPHPPPGDFTPNYQDDLLATRRDILDRLGDPNVVILDTRRRSEYLGTEVRTARSGTIPGAIHLQWSNNLAPQGTIRDAAGARAIFEQHGVTPDKEIIAFCGGGYRSSHSYLVLTMLGYPNVRNYLGSWGEWGNRDDTPIVVPEG